MSNDYKEIVSSTELLPFAELYDFVFTTENFSLYYTNYPTHITYRERIYKPVGIQRSSIKQEKLEDITITITLFTKDDATFTFLNFDIPIIKIVIRRYFFEFNVVKTIFVGEGTVVGIQDRTINLQAKDILSIAMSKTVPKFLYSAYCCHSLFDKNCGLNKEDFKVTTQVSLSDNGKNLISSTFSNFSDNYFTNGYVKFGNTFRLIVSHSGNKITLHFPIKELQDGDEVEVYPGCNKTPSDCKNKFNNYSNFLGFPYIPTKNPTIFGFT